MTRYCHKDTGDMEIEVQCACWGSTDIDQEGFDTLMYPENPLVILSDEEWDKKLAEYKKEQPEEQDETDEEQEENQKEKEEK